VHNCEHKIHEEEGAKEDETVEVESRDERILLIPKDVQDLRPPLSRDYLKHSEKTLQDGVEVSESIVQTIHFVLRWLSIEIQLVKVCALGRRWTLLPSTQIVAGSWIKHKRRTCAALHSTSLL
jgi:hypothetical protein